MTLLAGGVIDQARSRHAAFDQSRHPHRVVLDFLTAYARQLHGRVARIDAEVLSATISVAIPLASHTAGIPLGGVRRVSEVVVRDSAGRDFPVDLIPHSHRNDAGIRTASAWQVGQTLFLAGPATLWDRMASVVIHAVAVPVPLTNLEAEIPLPDTAEMALVEQTAFFMARRHPNDAKAPELDVTLFGQVAAKAEESFLEDIVSGLSGQLLRTRDVYSP